MPTGHHRPQQLSGMVWDHPERLEKLNSLVHPPVRRARRKADGRNRRRPIPHAIAVVEAAILVETGRYKNFDRLIVVTCTAEQQMERALERGSYSKEEILARLSRQLPLEEKLRVADYVIDTSGSKESDARAGAKRFTSSLRSLTA